MSTDNTEADDSSSDYGQGKPKQGKKKKAPKEKKPKQYPQFLKGHPQCETHSIHMAAEDEPIVPNFVGGTLPRKDKGNYEDYCLTMLTLFKPWRIGSDLKTNNQTWQEAFETYTFTPRQLELMKFFHIRYECNDARDDFHAQRKAAEKENRKMSLNPIFGQFQNDLDDQYREDRNSDGALNDNELEWLSTQFDEISGKTANKVIQMAEIEQVLQ
ncbi:hypothetical protein FA95DRAFT_1665540, partial [Auriscalpium vulgare]